MLSKYVLWLLFCLQKTWYLEHIGAKKLWQMTVISPMCLSDGYCYSNIWKAIKWYSIWLFSFLQPTLYHSNQIMHDDREQSPLQSWWPQSQWGTKNKKRYFHNRLWFSGNSVALDNTNFTPHSAAQGIFMFTLKPHFWWRLYIYFFSFWLLLCCCSSWSAPAAMLHLNSSTSAPRRNWMLESYISLHYPSVLAFLYELIICLVYIL